MLFVRFRCKLCIIFLIFIIIASDSHISLILGNKIRPRSWPTSPRSAPVPLLFPPTSPTRIQLIAGIGIPLNDLKLESMTSGYVLKAEYFLPESTEQFKGPSSLSLTSRRHLIDGEPAECCQWDNGTVSPSRTSSKSINRKWPISRSSIYRILTKLLSESSRDKQQGHSCLLKSICEVAANPFHHVHGLLGEILHIILLPSMSNDNFDGENEPSQEPQHSSQDNHDSLGRRGHETKDMDEKNAIYWMSNNNNNNHNNKNQTDDHKDNHNSNGNDVDRHETMDEGNPDYVNGKKDQQTIKKEMSKGWSKGRTMLKRSKFRKDIDGVDGQLTPTDDIDYRRAENLGAQGIDCHQRFPTCPESLLAHFTRIIVS